MSTAFRQLWQRDPTAARQTMLRRIAGSLSILSPQEVHRHALTRYVSVQAWQAQYMSMEMQPHVCSVGRPHATSKWRKYYLNKRRSWVMQRSTTSSAIFACEATITQRRGDLNVVTPLRSCAEHKVPTIQLALQTGSGRYNADQRHGRKPGEAPTPYMAISKSGCRELECHGSRPEWPRIMLNASACGHPHCIP